MSTQPRPAVSSLVSPLLPAFQPKTLADRLKLWLLERKAAIRHFQTIANLSPESPCKWTRERFDVTAAKIMLIDDLLAEVDPIVKDAENLTGKKPSSLPAESIRLQVALEEALWALKWHTEKDGSAVGKNAMRMISALLGETPQTLSGSAEEQPLTSEEARPLTGTCPVTADAPNPLPADSGELRQLLANGYTVAELQTLSEACLDALESRGVVTHWSLTGY